ncbi:MAG: kynureninase [Burkholderiaceae bacterium]
MCTQTLHAEPSRHIDTRAKVRTRADCVALDAADPLAAMRDLFALPDDVIYLDGNSLGALPRSTASRVADVIEKQWGNELIASWNSAGWIAAPRRIGDALAPLIGARAGEVVVADSTSINLFKVLTVAMRLATESSATRRVVVSEADNFPTDLYIAEGVLRGRGDGATLKLVPATASDARSEAIVSRLDASTAVLMLTHVNYRTGAMHDMKALTRAAHDAGALVVWDLAHSAGAVTVDLHDADADFAIGCGYKYLNGGPGAPAFLWVHPCHVERFMQPLSGWMGHAAPFAFEPDYEPAAGVDRFLCGTPAILSMAALEGGIASLDSLTGAADPMPALRAKSIALTELFIEQVESRCGEALVLATPRDAARRGSQVSFHARGALVVHGYALMQALIECGVIGDFRKGTADDGDILRFGFAPAYLRYVDAFDAAEAIDDALASEAYRDPRFQVRAAVT